MGRLVTWSRSIFKRFGSERLQLKLPTYFIGYGWQRSVKLVQLQFLGHPAVKTLPKQSQKSGAGFWLANTCEIVVTPASMEGTRWILSSLYLFQLLDCGCVGPLSWKVSSLQTVFRICIFIKVGVSVLLTVLFCWTVKSKVNKHHLSWGRTRTLARSRCLHVPHTRTPQFSPTRFACKELMRQRL